MHPQRRRQLRFFFHRWHRRIGLASALVIIFVAVTGVALNHTGGLNLGGTYPQGLVLLLPYRDLIPDEQIFPTPDGQLVAHDSILFLGPRQLSGCNQLIGYAVSGDEKLVACDDVWHLFAEDWVLIESFDPALASLAPEALPGVSDGGLAIHQNDAWYRFDSDALLLGDSVASGELTQPERSPGTNRVISWQRLMQDMHSGRWFGSVGIWVVDAAALMLIMLSLSGFWLWWSRQRNRL